MPLYLLAFFVDHPILGSAIPSYLQTNHSSLKLFRSTSETISSSAKQYAGFRELYLEFLKSVKGQQQLKLCNQLAIAKIALINDEFFALIMDAKHERPVLCKPEETYCEIAFSVNYIVDNYRSLAFTPPILRYFASVRGIAMLSELKVEDFITLAKSSDEIRERLENFLVTPTGSLKLASFTPEECKEIAEAFNLNLNDVEMSDTATGTKRAAKEDLTGDRKRACLSGDMDTTE